MNFLAGEWWDSDPWWQFGITVIASLAVGALGAWASMRASNPKRKINWWVESNTPLLISDQPDDGQELAVHLEGIRVANPRVVELGIANVGSRDITAAMFHENQPIRFDFGTAEVFGIIGRQTEPEGAAHPEFIFDSVIVMGTIVRGAPWLDLHPSLLKRGQTSLVRVLISGEEQKVKCTHAGLVDVDVVPASPGRRAQAMADAMAGFTLHLGPFLIRLGGQDPRRP